MPRLGRRERVDRALMAATVAGAAVALRFAPACGFLSMTGRPCPLCGGNRSAACLARGDLAGAWEWNPSAIAWVTAAALVAGAWALEAASGRAFARPSWWGRACASATAALAALTLGAWGARLSGLAFPWPG